MVCRTCQKDKSSKMFYSTSGHLCKECEKKRVKKWQKENKERYRESRKKRLRWRQQNDPAFREKKRLYYRRWYKKHGRKRKRGYEQVIVRWQEDHPKEVKTGQETRYAIQTKKLVKPKVCCICNREAKIIAHHLDYNDAFLVLWVCASCHKRIHNGDIKLAV